MIRLISAVALLILVSTSAAESAQGQFHPPQTAAERALDKILLLSIKSDGNLDYFVLQEPYYDPKKDAGYRELFTPSLLATLAKLQAALVQRECGGQYKEGEVCGFDTSPTLCGQDYPEHYLYRTEEQTGSRAIIATAWPQTDQKPATYRLLREKGRWVLDGIHCSRMDAFH